MGIAIVSTLCISLKKVGVHCSYHCPAEEDRGADLWRRVCTIIFLIVIVWVILVSVCCSYSVLCVLASSIVLSYIRVQCGVIFLLLSPSVLLLWSWCLSFVFIYVIFFCVSLVLYPLLSSTRLYSIYSPLFYLLYLSLISIFVLFSPSNSWLSFVQIQ